jgi:hypothetical protein
LREQAAAYSRSDKKSTGRIDSLKIYSKGHSLPHVKIYSKK